MVIDYLYRIIWKVTEKYRYIFLAICFMIITVGLKGIDPDIKLQFEQVTSIDGLSNNTVYDIVQDHEGFIWVATREGLNCFDGQLITSYYQEGVSSIPGNFVLQLHITSEGKLLVGTRKGVGIYHKKSDSFSLLKYQGRSLGDVNRIIEISSKNILISTMNGLYLLDKNLEVSLISNQIFRDLCEFQTGIIWGLVEDDIVIINVKGEVIRKYNTGVESLGDIDISSENIECLYKDLTGTIWIGTKRDGLIYYDLENDKFHKLELDFGVNPIEDNFIRVISEDGMGGLWIGTESGLYIYDQESNEFLFFGQSFSPNEKGLNDKAIYSIFRSREQMMWIGTYFGGVNYTSLNPRGFNRIYADGGHYGLSGNAVSEIIEANDGRLWIGTEDGGISILEPENGKFTYLKHIPGESWSLSSNNVHALEEDAQGNIWIGTFIGGLHRYNKRLGTIESVNMVPPELGMKEDVYSKSLFSIHIDSKNRVWAGSIGGLYMRETEEDEFTLWNPGLFLNNFIYQIEEDHSGNIWICSYDQGIFMIDTAMQVSNYREGSNHDILSNRIIYCYVDSSAITWFGTLDGGLLKYDGKKHFFTSYTRENGMPNNTVYAITKDASGFLWLSTNRGISRFDPKKETFVNYSVDDGLIGNQFNFKSGLCSSNGMMYFGAVNGLSYFDPERLRFDNTVPEVHFTDFKLSNNSVKIGQEEILKSHIDFQKEIRLKYQDKVFTFEFVALNFMSPGKVDYAYYMEGLESDWNYVGNMRSATYTNLLPGKYIFHLSANNGDQNWPDNERNMTIYISPPFWISTPGFLLYGLILVSSILLIIRFSLVRQKEKMNVRLATLEKQKNEEISQHRLNFFTYISHEFKTPLTLIIATLEHIMNYEEVLPKFKNYGMLMRKNALRLLFLINQLMDFRKIETDHAALRFNKGEVIGFIKSTFMAFYPLMEKLSVKSSFTSSVDSYIVFFDADKLEKILTNIISNSCKAMKQGGSISIDVKIIERTHLADPSSETEKTGDLLISISDDGPGIPQDKLKKLFVPFVPLDSGDIQSTGIGLSLVNSLVKYLNGQINISCPPKGGTKVVIQLPLVHNPSPELIKNDMFLDSNSGLAQTDLNFFINSEPEADFNFQDNGIAKEYEIMVVEDNTELASFLHHHFAPIFKITLAVNGKEALNKIKKSHPDLIISDIMMPGMDGFALCNAIKGSIETCHIPLILLTSKDNLESRIEGLHRGADAYVGKPFNLKELDLHVRNILKSKENLRRHFSKLDFLKESVGQLGNKDQQFIKDLVEIVYNHLDEGSFDVELFCREVHISRTLMHMKLKKITGLSTTEFIRNIRLGEAEKMLRKGHLTVSEIAYRVGFNDPTYFSKSFKKHFGKLPSSIASKES